jgi:speckle-type POZ protein
MGSGLSITSVTFSVGGHDWNIISIPNNPIYSVADDGGAVQPFISVYLALMSKGAKVRASCDLGLVDHTTGLPSSVHRTPEPREFRYGDDSMFFPQTEAFMDCAQLEASAYLQDDRLTIHCDIAVIQKPSVSTTNMFVGRLEASPSNITEHLAKLLETGEGADVTLFVGGETFVAHKFLLAARSPVFGAELCGPMREAETQHVTVDDMQPHVFRALLNFIYTDSLPPDTDDVWGYTDNRMIQHLLVAANRYDVDRLKLVCQGIGHPL